MKYFKMYPEKLKSLHQICIQSILNNMETLWCRHFLKEMNDTHWLFVEGPFDTIHPDTCNEILGCLHAKRALKKHHIYLLINPGLLKLELSGIKEPNSSLIFRLLAVRCRNLKYLDLTNCGIKTEYFLPVTVKCFSNVTELQLSGTGIGDSEVSMIGVSALKLKHLNLNDLSRVSNNGIRTLFKQVNLNGQPNSNYGKCQNLISLNVSGTSVTPSGGAECLQALTSTLVNFHCHNSFKAVLKYLIQSQQPSTLKIRCLHIDLEDWTMTDKVDFSEEVSLNLVAQFCPNIQDISVNFGDAFPVKETSLNAFFTSPRILKSLFFVTDHSSLQVVAGDIFGIAVALQGQNLANVHLVSISGVSLTQILNFCPNLEKLHLDFASFQPYTEIEPRGKLTHLKSFRLLCLKAQEPFLSSPSSFELKTLMRNASSLESIQIADCDQLTDELFVDLGDDTDMLYPSLKTFHLSNCNSISMDCVLAILPLRGELMEVTLENCNRIYRSHFEEFKQLLKKNQLSIRASWS